MPAATGAGRVLARAAIVSSVVLASCATNADEDRAAPDPSVTDTDDAADAAEVAETVDTAPSSSQASAKRFRYPPAPAAPSATDRSNAEAAAAIDRFNSQIREGLFDFEAISELAEVGDARHAWLVVDALRFFRAQEAVQLINAFETLTGATLADDPDNRSSSWLSASNHLIAWDTPAYPGYREDKQDIYLLIEPAWEPFFEDADGDLDWRYVSWGGVLADQRELGDRAPCPGGCIPALDDPKVTDAAGGDWYPDDRIVFGLVENGDALAIPLNIAEVHEMFNLTLGGRRLAIPYCTLCGSAQAFFTDNTQAATQPVLRTSGLLSRSNKVMYDLPTRSAFDTFTGAAATGPLREQGTQLEETTVVRSTWGEWKSQHPDTAIIAEDGGLERVYPLDPLVGRDDRGPIFPVGLIDDRLPEQELVVGVIAPDGTPVAFPSEMASMALGLGRDVELNDVTLSASGDGLVATDQDGERLPAHEAFWFAWSQFHPDTLLWPR